MPIACGSTTGITRVALYEEGGLVCRECLLAIANICAPLVIGQRFFYNTTA